MGLRALESPGDNFCANRRTGLEAYIGADIDQDCEVDFDDLLLVLDSMGAGPGFRDADAWCQVNPVRPP